MAAHLKPLVFAFQAAVDQTQSPLFSTLPTELRERIFNLCLTDSENVARKYDENSLWNRPGHYAPHISHTEILRTCKKCYQEAWFMAWANREQNIYLVAPDRRPHDATNPFALEAQLLSLAASHGEVGIKHVHLFSQLYLLENIQPLQGILDIAHFFPKRMTITIRHTDFWYWEDDAPLRIRHGWVRHCRFPDSLVELQLDFETLQRKKEQVKYLASQAAQSWIFTRKDGQRLVSSCDQITTTTWAGQSTLNDARWIRDEVRPGGLDYVISTIAFKVENRTTKVFADQRQKLPQDLDLRVPDHVGHPIRCDRPFLHVPELLAARVPSFVAAAEALRRVEAYENGENPGPNNDSEGDSTSQQVYNDIVVVNNEDFVTLGEGGMSPTVIRTSILDSRSLHVNGAATLTEGIISEDDDAEDQDYIDSDHEDENVDGDSYDGSVSRSASDEDYDDHVPVAVTPTIPLVDFSRFGGHSTRYARQWHDHLRDATLRK
ncbi:hypothetical protein K461DRAFT_42381 [Myriangium duriaei CBS 260.36]|uniref:F-box domain-containing protein n=1 Tax=Myriangium duriaei CBS 260.36 TaxID=1168546 RepID=A0A9P4IUV2_9PEZI|nr:hypothetical protein K461DRAFT_42381 [Myriangium duriaei CBS 260.36]